MSNKKYKYNFTVDFGDYGNITIYISHKKYTQEEFNNLCLDVLKRLVFDNLKKMKINAIFPDNNINKKGSLITEHSYRLIETYEQEFNSEMNKLGFSIDCSSTEAGCYVDNYSFIRETFGKEINEIMDARSKNENIPVLTEEQKMKWFSFETQEDRNKFVESLKRT
jgi:hypothetical protein